MTLQVWVHSPTTLYLMNVDDLALYAAWTFFFYDSDGGAMANQEMVDIALSTGGEMYGVSWDPVAGGGNHLYRIEYTTTVGSGGAYAHRISSLPWFYNALTFAPADMMDEPTEVLVGVDNNSGFTTSYVDIIDTATGAVSTIGSFGSDLKSSGDIVAVEGLGLYATVTNNDGTEFLARVDPISAQASIVGSGIGATYENVWGLAFWGGRFFGYCSDGQILTIDATTGAGTTARTYAAALYGAAMTPLAPLTP